MRSDIKKWLRYGISLTLAVGILAVLLGRQRWEHLCVEVDWHWLVLAVALAGVYWSVRVARWRWMVTLEDQRIGWGRAWVSMLAGLGVGLITPMRSGEVVRAMFLPKGARLRLAGWVVIERLFDLSAVLTLCILGLFYAVFSGTLLVAGKSVSPWLLLICPLLLVAALGVPLLLHYRPAGLLRILSRLLPAKVKQLIGTRLTWRQFGIFYAVSLASALLSVLAVFGCLRAYGHIRLIEAVALTPVVMLNNLLPATPGGFGVREGTAVLVFGAFGFSESMVLAAYLTNALIVLVIPGTAGVIAAWITGVMRQLKTQEQELT